MIAVCEDRDGIVTETPISVYCVSESDSLNNTVGKERDISITYDTNKDRDDDDLDDKIVAVVRGNSRNEDARNTRRAYNFSFDPLCVEDIVSRVKDFMRERRTAYPMLSKYTRFSGRASKRSRRRELSANRKSAECLFHMRKEERILFAWIEYLEQLHSENGFFLSTQKAE